MSGITNLSEVLKSLIISCDDCEYGFATKQDANFLFEKPMFAVIQEEEGLTLVAQTQYLKEKGLSYEGVYAKLTIEVHTSLELVGLTAVLASKLAENNISANVIAAYYHDHIFIPFNLRKQAIDALNTLKGE